jgi:signal transduction histidine kinase
LVGTAIANAEAQAALTASRARIVAAADRVRRRIERDLHDGAQQRLVSVALQLRAVQAAAPSAAGDLVTQVDAAADELIGLVGLTDRVEALGGRLSLQSPPGAGSTVQIALPLAAPDGPR